MLEQEDRSGWRFNIQSKGNPLWIWPRTSAPQLAGAAAGARILIGIVLIIFLLMVLGIFAVT
jgi:hypothetical protein